MTIPRPSQTQHWKLLFCSARLICCSHQFDNFITINTTESTSTSILRCLRCIPGIVTFPRSITGPKGQVISQQLKKKRASFNGFTIYGDLKDTAKVDISKHARSIKETNLFSKEKPCLVNSMEALYITCIMSVLSL